MTEPASPRVPHAIALYLAVVQLLFAVTWTVYAIYLPRLLESAGISARYTVWVLMFDQLVFMVMDVVMGVAADRAGRMLGRIGPLIIGATVVSCIAFLLIPHAALLGRAATTASLMLVLIWTATSSALRAPPWVLLSKYAAAPSLPWMNALMLTGLAIGGALAPYLGVALKNIDPRLPFALSSLVLLAATIGLIRVERYLALQPRVAEHGVAPARALIAGTGVFLVGCLLLAQGFQIHSSLSSTGQYLRYARPEQLEYLMPIIWIGVNVAMFPGAALAKRYGTLPVIAAAAVIGAGGTLLSARAPSLELLIAGQLMAGGAWGCVMMASFAAALEFGRTGREGLALGLLFGVLAAAAFSRMAIMAGGLHTLPDIAPVLGWAPIVLWFAGGALFTALAVRSRRAAARGG
jgi:MFS family permease